MNITKPIFILSLASTLFFSCKDTASKPIEHNTEASQEKKVSVAAKPETASFKIDGMTCAIGCAKSIETRLANMNGVQKATVDFDNKQATVSFDAAILNSAKIVKAVESIGDGETYTVSELKTKG